jgi:hypothetical protein
MSESQFAGIWIERVGPTATAALQRSGSAVLIAGPVCLGLGIAASFAFGTGSAAGFLLDSACIVGCVGCIVLIVWSRMRFAAALSEWFQTNISWRELPRMRSTQFDVWASARGFSRRT